jgi:TolB-like protein/tetratricopeptide (TPR) repeat protein
MNFKKLISELKRRNVFRVAGVYAVTGWLLIQVVTSVFPTFKFPDWTAQFVIILVLIGFPIAIILAWAFEMTTEGVKRTGEVHPEHSITKATGKKLNNIILIVLALAVLVLFYKDFFGRQTAPSNSYKTKPVAADTLSIPSRSIAVLPFTNMSPDTNNAYFASGIRDLILTKLDEIGGLKVIARTTSDQYKSRPEDLRTVGRQLGVATVLEGSVQKAGNQVLINVQLIKTTTSGHLWARDYTRTLTNIFGVEGEVADSIAQSLHTTLTPEEAKTIHQIPTRNPQAYDLYLKANYNIIAASTGQVSDMKWNESIDLYEKAIHLDTTFALAYVGKAEALAYENLASGFDKGRYEKAYKAAQKALKLNPGLPEAFQAMGYTNLWGSLDYKSALRYFEKAYAKMPNNPNLLESISDAHKRLGQWKQARTELERVTRLDPRNSIYLARLGELYTHLRLYTKAESAYRQGLSVNPNDVQLRISYFAPTLMMEGKLDSTRDMLLRLTQTGAIKGDIIKNLAKALLGHIYADEHKFDKAREALESLKPGTTVSSFGLYTFGLSLMDPTISIVRLYLDRGNKEKARDEAQMAMDSLNFYWGPYKDHHDFVGAGYYVGLAWVKAGLGDKEGAVRAARKAIQIMPVTRDALFGPWYMEALAEIYAQTGYTNQAIATLKQLMEMKGAGNVSSPAELRQDPVWDPLRKYQAFQALLKKYPLKKESK